MATDDRCNLVKVYNGGSCSWEDFEAAMKVATPHDVVEWADKVVWARLPDTQRSPQATALTNLMLLGETLLEYTKEELKSDFKGEGGSVGAAVALFNAIDKLRRGACVTCSSARCAVSMSACCRAPCLPCVCTFVL